MSAPILVIGSTAFNSECQRRHLAYNKARDLDVITTFEGLQQILRVSCPIHVDYRAANKVIIFEKHLIIEIEVAHPGSAAMDLLDYMKTQKLRRTGRYGANSFIANLDMLYTIKMSHRYLKNNPHFLKTMRDIHYMRHLGAQIFDDQWLKKREAETYKYSHPKLNKAKDQFFADDGVNYVYDHDTLHTVVAVGDRPAYMEYQVEGADVLCSKEKFFSVDEHTRLYGVYEEACVLAIERAVIPYNTDPDKAFEIALEKVCTSITSGWFREFAWENYDQVLVMHQMATNIGQGYYKKFKEWESSNGKVEQGN